MGDSSSSNSDQQSFMRRHWEGYIRFWGDRFSFMDNYARFITKRETPLPPWSSADVEEFIASDPVHGPTLKTARDAVNFGLAGSALGALHLSGFALKYSKSLHGAGMALVAGAAFGWTFGQEVANHWYQLYTVDTMAAQTKYLEWWQNKCERQS